MASIPRKVNPGDGIKASAWNELIDYVRSMTPQPGSGVRVTTGASGTTFAASPGGSRGKSKTTFTPFKVYPSTDNTSPPYPILKVYPGKIAGITPTLANAKLDVLDTASGLHPWFYPPGSPFSFFLQCKISVDSTNLYRSAISEVKVVTDDDPSAVGDIDPDTNEIIESKIKWDDEHSKTAGHFYLKIADVDMGTVGGNIVLKGVTQWLFDSHSTFVAVGDYVEVIV